MKKFLLGGVVAAASALLMTAPVNAAAIYTSYLEYKDVGGSTPSKAGPFGKVTLTEVDAYTVQVNVILYSPEVAFLNTGGPHEPFLFNLTGDYDVTVQNAMAGGKMQTFYDAGYDSDTSAAPNFTATPFGNFTNKIGCCGDANGAKYDSYPPLNFTVHDTNGITFAGAGALFDSNGKLFQLGTGDRFKSNDGGWWFTADLVDNKGNTFNVAARDAFKIKQGAVPEPASWALMITGFGVIGVGMRRGKAAQRQTQAA